MVVCMLIHAASTKSSTLSSCTCPHRVPLAAKVAGAEDMVRGCDDATGLVALPDAMATALMTVSVWSTVMGSVYRGEAEVGVERSSS